MERRTPGQPCTACSPCTATTVLNWNNAKFNKLFLYNIARINIFAPLRLVRLLLISISRFPLLAPIFPTHISWLSACRCSGRLALSAAGQENSIYNIDSVQPHSSRWPSIFADLRPLQSTKRGDLFDSVTPYLGAFHQGKPFNLGQPKEQAT